MSPHRVKAQDRGLVVVGGSVRRGDLQAAEAGALTGGALEGVLEQEEAWEASEAGHAHSAAAGQFRGAWGQPLCHPLCPRPGRSAGRLHAVGLVEHAGRGATGPTWQLPAWCALAGAAKAKAAGGGKTGADSSRHFSYFAFDGGSGQPRWSHTTSSFHRPEEVEAAAEEVTPQHSYR